MAFLEAHGIVKRYVVGGTTLTVLRDLDLTVEAGEMVGIMGASGVGKSTLLHILGGLDRPEQGTVVVADTAVTTLPDAAVVAFRNRRVGFVFQFHHLLPEFSALENTMMPGLIRRMPPWKAEKEAERILFQLGLGDRLQHKPGELSGGEQQRVAVARALMLSPQVILADEPTGNLDTQTGDEVHNLLLGINREQGITIVIVTHNPLLAARMTRRIRLADGRLQEKG